MEKPDFSAFGQFIPGFDFLQQLARQATGGVAPGLQSAAAAMPSLGHWVAPTFSVEEIDKRIQDLRAVQFWLDQNGKALGATIQALEVQKMTLSTLENMNLSLKDVAESFKIKPEMMQAAQPAQAAPKPAEPKAEATAQAQEEDKAQVDPMQWWNSLTEQFTTIASGALQDMAGQAAKAAEQVAQTVQAGAEQMAQTVQASTEAAEKMAEQAKEEASRAASAVDAASRKRAAPAKKASAKSAAAPASASSRTRKKPAA